jgi:membrane-bound serine protease (ClpP class)
VILIDVDLPGYGISTPLLIGIATTAALVLLGVVWLAMRARRRPVVSGVEELRHSFATALEAFDHEGPVRTHGERWRARSASPVRQGQRLKVVAVEDLVLIVEPDDEPN